MMGAAINDCMTTWGMPEDMKALWYGRFNSVGWMTIPLGPYFGGWIYANYGRAHLFLLSAACYGANILLNVLFFEESLPADKMRPWRGFGECASPALATFQVVRRQSDLTPTL
jgi:hypothetical protein